MDALKEMFGLDRLDGGRSVASALQVPLVHRFVAQREYAADYAHGLPSRTNNVEEAIKMFDKCIDRFKWCRLPAVYYHRCADNHKTREFTLMEEAPDGSKHEVAWLNFSTRERDTERK